MVTKGKFYVPIFDCTVTITISDDPRKSLNYYLEKYGDEKIDYNISGFCYRPESGIGKYFLFFEKCTLDSNYWNHEKSHLVETILTDRDMKPVDELRSYLDGFISKKMNQFLLNRKMRLK